VLRTQSRSDCGSRLTCRGGGTTFVSNKVKIGDGKSMIDQAKKSALIKHIKRQKVLSDKTLLLAPDLYFDGYDDAQCTICANNSKPVSTSKFAARLYDIQNRPDVSALFVRFYDFSDAEDCEDIWISSDSVYVVTAADLETVREWFSDFQVSDVWAENDYSKFVGLPKIPNDSKLVAVWWD
jgi:hypothetical protein